MNVAVDISNTRAVYDSRRSPVKCVYKEQFGENNGGALEIDSPPALIS